MHTACTAPDNCRRANLAASRVFTANLQIVAGQPVKAGTSKARSMKLVSGTSNGLRASCGRTFSDTWGTNSPTCCACRKRVATKMTLSSFGGAYATYWNAAEKRGYAGPPSFPDASVARHPGIGKAAHDREGRVPPRSSLTSFRQVYVPNSQRELTRLGTASNGIAISPYLRKLERRKPVVWCGDPDRAQPTGPGNPKANVGNHGFTAEERAGFQRVREGGFPHTFRELRKPAGITPGGSNARRACAERRLAH